MKMIIRPNAILTIFLSLTVGILIVAIDSPIYKSLATLLIIVSFFVIIHPEIYIPLFLIIRSSLDILAGYKMLDVFNISTIVTVLLICVGALVLLKRENLIKISRERFLLWFNKIFLGLLFFSTLSLINRQNFFISLADWSRLLSILIIFNYAFISFSNKKGFKSLFNILIISVILPVSLGLYQYLFKVGNQDTLGFNRIYGTFLHPNVFAQYLVIILFAILYFFRVYKIRYTYKVALTTFIVLILFEIYHTFTRSIWITLAISILIFSATYKKISRKILCLLTLFLIILVLLPKFQTRFIDLVGHRPYELSSFEWRIHIWGKTLSEVKTHIITGHGFGMYQETFSFMAHNDYLRLLYEIGIVGLFFYLGVIFYILIAALKNFLKSLDGYDKTRYLTVICLTMSWLAIGLTDNLARSTVVLAYLFCVIGALMGGKTNSVGYENTSN